MDFGLDDPDVLLQPVEAANIRGAPGVLYIYIYLSALQRLCKVGNIISILQWEILTKRSAICLRPSR